jgi:hypothetical protein
VLARARPDDLMNPIWTTIKNTFTSISRVMKLEERVSLLEKKIDSLQAPMPNVREGIQYDKKWNFYRDAKTEECFCPTCLGNGKRIAVRLWESSLGWRWDCSNCKTEVAE